MSPNRPPQGDVPPVGGGLPPPRPIDQAYRPGSPTVISPQAPQTLRAELVLLTEQNAGFSGMFGYSPAVGAGNLIFSVAAKAGTDPWGNDYPAGLSTTAGSSTIEGTDYVINSDGEFFYSGTPGPANFLTGQNATFDGGDGTWTNTSAGNTIGNVTTPTRTGSGAMSINSTAAGTVSAAHCLIANITTQGLACSPGDVIFGSIWMRAAVTARSCTASVQFFTSAGALISTLTGIAVNDTATGWTRVTATVTAPATAAYCRLQIQIAATVTGEVHYADDAFLVNQTVTPGNLVGSWAAAAGTDSFGNPYPAGLSIGSATYPQVLLQPGSPHASLSFPLNAATAFTDPLVKAGALGSPEFADLILSGPVHPSRTDQVHVDLNSSDGTSSANGALAYLTTGNVDELVASWDDTGFAVLYPFRIGQQSLPATPSSGAVLFVDTNNTLYRLIPSGRYAALSDGSVSHTSHTVTASTLSVLTDTWIVPPNDAQVNTCYRLRAWGNGTQGSTTQQANWVFSYNGANNAQAGLGSTKFSASENFVWDAEMFAVATSIGSSAVISYKLTVHASANSVGSTGDGGYSIVRVGSFTADTTAQINLSLDFFWASTTGGPTITGRGSTFERIGA